MGFDMLTALQFALVLLAIWIQLVPRNKPAAANLPPSPKTLPLIGHLHLLGRVLHVSLRELSKRYGPLILLRFGSVPAVVVSSPELAREVLLTHDSVFASRPVRAVGKMFFYRCKDMASLPNDAEWKNARKLCSVELFTTKRLNSFDGLMREELGHLKSELLRFSEKQLVVTVRQPVREFSFNVITRILMRRTYFGANRVAEDHLAAEFVELMCLVPKSFGEFAVGDVFPSLSWLDFNFFRWRGIQQRLDKFLEKILADHRHKDSSSSEDFVDLLISHFGWNQTDEIKANLLDLLLGGTDTSLAVIEWALAELVRNPGEMRRAQDELMNKVGPRMVEFDDIPKLEFMHAIVKEVMRLHSPIPLLLPHFSTRHCKLESYDIPERTTVIVNVHAIGRDEKAWGPDSDSFRPERFEGSSINVHGFNFELLPFGAGRRICPGLLLGMKTVHFVLANLVHQFEWGYPEGVTAGDQVMEGSSGAVNAMASPLRLRVAPRFVI